MYPILKKVQSRFNMIYEDLKMKDLLTIVLYKRQKGQG